jgi:hypothetical protein
VGERGEHVEAEYESCQSPERDRIGLQLASGGRRGMRETRGGGLYNSVREPDRDV